jgi:SET domain
VHNIISLFCFRHQFIASQRVVDCVHINKLFSTSTEITLMKMQITSLLSGIISMVLLRSSHTAAQPVFSDQREANYPSCDVYLAPSPIAGWGVFAARDFEQFEVIEIAPRYLAMKKREFLKRSVLNDYFYGFTYDLDPTDLSFGNLAFGMTSFFNHGSGTKHNVQYTGFGREPDKNYPWASMVSAFTARRKIMRGEELLSSYGETERWFNVRGYPMLNDTEAYAMPSLEEIEQRERKYCAKTIAGVGHPTWVERVLPTCDVYKLYKPFIQLHGMLPVQDQPTAIAKEAVQAHQILEMAPAVVVPAKQMEFSPMAPMTIFWLDLDDEQRESIKQLREHGIFHLKAVSGETGQLEHDLLAFFDDAAILPVAGNIGLVRKVGPEEAAASNCRIEIVASVEKSAAGSTGVVLKLIATKDIEAGEELRLNLPDRSSWLSKMNLAQHLAFTGQPVPMYLLDANHSTTGSPSTTMLVH